MDLLFFTSLPLIALVLLGRRLSYQSRYFLKLASVPFVLLALFMIGLSLLLAAGVVVAGYLGLKALRSQRHNNLQLPE